MNDSPPQGATERTSDTPATEPESNGKGGKDPTSPLSKPPAVFDRLREQYAGATEARRETLLIVPGRFDSNLAARVKPVDWSERRKSARRLAKGGANEESEMQYGAATIVEATEAILVRLEDSGEFVPLHETVERWKGGPPVVWDSRLAELLGIEDPPNSARAICRLVFKNPEALNDFYVQLDAWLREAEPSDEDDEARPTR